MKNENIIQLNSLSFEYSKNIKVLDNICLNIPQGSIYGFIGPNGAGKSTTMSLLSGILTPKKNKVFLFGKAIEQQIPSIFSKIGFLIEFPALYLHLSGTDNLRYIAKLTGIKKNRIQEVLKLVDLQDAGSKKVKQYSLGMKQRLAIATALLNNPDLLILDEPVNGLDPAGIIEIRNILLKLNKENGTSIFISSHYLNEIEKICTHIGIINKGKIKFEGTLEEFKNINKNCRVKISVNNPELATQIISEKYETLSYPKDKNIVITLKTKEEITDCIKYIIDKEISIYQVQIIDDLETNFMAITE